MHTIKSSASYELCLKITHIQAIYDLKCHLYYVVFKKISLLPSQKYDYQFWQKLDKLAIHARSCYIKINNKRHGYICNTV